MRRPPRGQMFAPPPTRDTSRGGQLLKSGALLLYAIGTTRFSSCGCSAWGVASQTLPHTFPPGKKSIVYPVLSTARYQHFRPTLGQSSCQQPYPPGLCHESTICRINPKITSTHPRIWAHAIGRLLLIPMVIATTRASNREAGGRDHKA